MAFADAGNLIASGNTGANQATLTLATVGPVAAGSLVVAIVGDDNRVTGGGDDLATSGVTIGVYAMTKARQAASNLTAQTGASCSMWYAQVPGAIASGANVVATFTSATTSDATAMTVRHFTVAPSAGVIVTSTGALANDAADPGALNVTTTNEEHLRIRGIAGEASAALGGLTVTASWLDWTDGDSAATGTAAEMAVRCESIITTSTSGSSNPTWGTCDNVSVYATFKEISYKPRDAIDPVLHHAITQ